MEFLLCITLYTHLTEWKQSEGHSITNKIPETESNTSACMRQNYNHIKIARSLLPGDERNAMKLAKRKITTLYGLCRCTVD